MHLVGHSLGGHVIGIVGKNFTNPKIGRITSLDAGAPCLETSKPHIDGADAAYVEVIHSDAGM